jgi:hypothetical protein
MNGAFDQMKRQRTETKLVEDGVIQAGASPTEVAIGNMFDKRNSSLIKVLCRLSEVDYQAVRAGKIWFFLPARDQYGQVYGWHAKLPAGKSCLIYLSPLLEDLELQDCTLVAAHETAHFLLGHTDSPSTPEIEKAAWDRVIEMGFATQQEVDKLRSLLQGGSA